MPDQLTVGQPAVAIIQARLGDQAAVGALLPAGLELVVGPESARDSVVFESGTASLVHLGSGVVGFGEQAQFDAKGQLLVVLKADRDLAGVVPFVLRDAQGGELARAEVRWQEVETRVLVSLPGQSFKPGVGLVGEPRPAVTGDAVSLDLWVVDDQGRVDRFFVGRLGLDVLSQDGRSLASLQPLLKAGHCLVELAQLPASTDQGHVVAVSGTEGRQLVLPEGLRLLVHESTAPRESLVLLPGQRFVPGRGIVGGPTPQLAGVPFVVRLALIDSRGQVVAGAAASSLELAAEGAGLSVVLEGGPAEDGWLRSVVILSGAIDREASSVKSVPRLLAKAAPALVSRPSAPIPLVSPEVAVGIGVDSETEMSER